MNTAEQNLINHLLEVSKKNGGGRYIAIGELFNAKKCETTDVYACGNSVDEVRNEIKKTAKLTKGDCTLLFDTQTRKSLIINF